VNVLSFSRVSGGRLQRHAPEGGEPIRSDRRDEIKMRSILAEGQTILETNNHVLSGPQVRLENYGVQFTDFSRDNKSYKSKPDEPSKNELKKRAKAAEKEKKAAEKAAKLAEQQREREEAEEVWFLFHTSHLRHSQP
jgi:hypothetical protein